MSEKGSPLPMPPSRVLFYLVSFTMFLIAFYSVFLLQFDHNPFLFGPFFNFIHRKSSLTSSVNVARSLETQTKKIIEVTTCGDNNNSVVSRNTCDKNQASVRVYMYDLPSEFHFDLLGWEMGVYGHVWPNANKIPPYPGGLNLQHSIEYWLTVDLLFPNPERPCSAIRVMNSSEADIIFVPFFSSLSYNRHSKIQGWERVSVNQGLQDRLVEFLFGRSEWRKMGGRDHLIVAHHPNSMLSARTKLGSAMFVLADFGRYPAKIANLEKDVIAPYHHLVKTVPNHHSAPFDRRPILVYFQGAIYRKDKGEIRQELYYLLKDEKDVHFAFGSVQGHGISKAGEGMSSAKFCLNIAGDTPSSNRLFDSIATHCVPVIISDEIELPFEDVLDYREFCVFVKASDALKHGFLLNLLRGMKPKRWTQMWNRLKEVENHFEYHFPSQTGDAVDMIWQAVSRKVSSLRLKLHRMNRYGRSY